MNDRIVLVVSDEGDDKWGEISVFDTSREAERQMETLLEAGFDSRRIQVLAGSEAGFETTYRPAVSLVSGTSREAKPDRPARAIGQAASKILKVREEADQAAAHKGDDRSASGVRLSDRLRRTRDDTVDMYISAAEAAS